MSMNLCYPESFQEESVISRGFCIDTAFLAGGI